MKYKCYGGAVVFEEVVVVVEALVVPSKSSIKPLLHIAHVKSFN